MSIVKIHTYTTLGLVGERVTVEVDMNNSLPKLEVIGLPDAAIKEAKERIRSTFRNCHIKLPNKKIVINLAPSHLRKIGTRFDLPMAVGVLLLVEGVSDHHLFSRSLFFGELGLDGAVKPIRGLLPAVIAAYKHGWRSFVVPADNSNELTAIPDIEIYPIAHFQEILDALQGTKLLQPATTTQDLTKLENTQLSMVDFADIQGHLVAKRALQVAATGMHNALLVGPPGSGKTMLAKALQSILPPLSFEQVIEVSQIYSLVGKLDKKCPLIVQRPRRGVHHTASKVSIVGGGQLLLPGEISLSHRGILFFDELPEFPREVLEVLRQPLEDKEITISRAQGSVRYPADVMFIGAMNPCKCGYYMDREKTCTCSLHDIKHYQNKISGPLLDRFDMILEIPREKIDTIMAKKNQQNSAELRESIIEARRIQQKRYKDTPFYTNAELTAKAVRSYLSLDNEVETYLKTSVRRLHLSPRVVHRSIKLARSIADLEQSTTITKQHMGEALQRRAKRLFVDNG